MPRPIYFAGHGFLDNGKGYLAPVDMDLSHLAETGFPMDERMDRLESEAKQIDIAALVGESICEIEIGRLSRALGCWSQIVIR
jgi:hypothetical protein